jgi:hypothetical protein
MMHIDCLDTILNRNHLHAPSCVPEDGLAYESIHARQTQWDRGNKRVPCGPGGEIRNYVGFYFGPRSPMLYRIHTGRNVDQVEQSRIIYLVTTAQAVDAAGLEYVFTDRHTLTAVAEFRHQLDDLGMVDFQTTYELWWNDTHQHPDRQEKKQAEFLVHDSMPWSLIERIGALNADVATQVETVLHAHPGRHRPRVERQPSWYY